MVDVNGTVYHLRTDIYSCATGYQFSDVPALVDENSAVHYFRTDIWTLDKG